MADTVLDFRWSTDDLTFWRTGQAEKALARALRLSGNRAIRSLQGSAIAFALSKKNLTKATEKSDQRIILPHRARLISDFSWVLFVQGRPVPAAKFPHVDTRFLSTRRGVLVRFGAGAKERLSGAFTARMASGHLGVFKRSKKTRLPIEEVFSSRLPKAFGSEVMSTYGEKTYRKMEDAFSRGLQRELAKVARKGAV